MTAQPALDFGLLVTPAPDEDLTIQQRFEQWHALNPWVYTALEHLVEDWLAMGHTRVGIKQLFEVLRWNYGRKTVGDTFKVNNDFTSRYARMLVADHPEWAEAIEIRSLRAD